MSGAHTFELPGVNIGDKVWLDAATPNAPVLTATDNGEAPWGVVTHIHRDDRVVVLTNTIGA